MSKSVKKPTMTRPPRRDKRNERIEILQQQLKAAGQREDAKDRRSNEQVAIRVYRMLEAERAELLARANKLDVIMKSMGIQVPNDCSPSSYMPVEF